MFNVFSTKPVWELLTNHRISNATSEDLVRLRHREKWNVLFRLYGILAHRVTNLFASRDRTRLLSSRPGPSKGALRHENVACTDSLRTSIPVSAHTRQLTSTFTGFFCPCSPISCRDFCPTEYSPNSPTISSRHPVGDFVLSPRESGKHPGVQLDGINSKELEGLWILRRGVYLDVQLAVIFWQRDKETQSFLRRSHSFAKRKYIRRTQFSIGITRKKLLEDLLTRFLKKIERFAGISRHKQIEVLQRNTN